MTDSKFKSFIDLLILLFSSYGSMICQFDMFRFVNLNRYGQRPMKEVFCCVNG